MSHHHHQGEAERHFSASFFVIVITASLALLYASVAFFAPNTFLGEARVGWLSLAIAFLAVHLANSFVEFFFHRYVLHAPVVPFLAYFYRQHTLHHALTRVRPPRGGSGVDNKFPIIEEEQHEASFFPAYSPLLFALLATPMFALVKWLWPEVPVFLPGYAAIMWSLSLYELLHALEHKPVKDWEPLLEHPKFGGFWKTVYAFHLRHHADIHSNESISGFFGIPVPDFVFGTWVNPNTLYEHGTYVHQVEFRPPSPRLIGWLDRYAAMTVRKRRAHGAS